MFSKIFKVSYKYLLLFLIPSFLVANIAIANDPEYQVIRCDTCSSYLDYSNAAKQAELGDVVVVNLLHMDAKSFENVPHWQYPATRMTSLSRNFAGISETMVALAELRDSLSNYDSSNPPNDQSPPLDPPGSEIPFFVDMDITKIEIDSLVLESSTLNFSSTSNSNDISNGCGSPEAFGYEAIPNVPFKTACDAHDACFSAGLGFGYCNDEFLDDMRNLVPLWVDVIAAAANKNNPLFKFGATVALNAQAEIYHFAVNGETAYNVYCGIHWNSIECRGTNAIDTPITLGQRIGENTRPETNVIGVLLYFWSCELWQFPDGNGGFYRMNRNCRIVYIGS